MKRILLLALITIAAINLFAQDWKPAGDKIKTEWAEKVDPNNPLPEYPRPQLVRNSWKNLNGLWNYAILPKGGNIPESFDGKILVPFAIESSLSGVQKRVGKNNELWYQQSLSIPKEWKNKNIVLHFGGVDWKADIWLNDIKIGSHQGGYTPFSFDITPFLNKSGDQKLLVKVWDPTSDGYHPRGKQVVKPG
ncbi:MAG: beta-galactosidase, partial [Bacteroidetes bacterium]|nr:beta-galactosidase [Bacteroidota bacterium]